MEQKNYFNELITNDEHFYDLPDCISECSDYKDLIERSFNLTKGLLILNSFECSQSDNNFTLKIGLDKGKEYTIIVQRSSDYIDAIGLIQGLNSILGLNNNETGKIFIELSGGVVDFGIAFIKPEQEVELAKQGLIWRNEQFYIDYENSKYAKIENQVQDNNKPDRRKNKPWWKIW